MIILSNAMARWPSDGFKQALKEDLGALDVSQLPLQQGLLHSSAVSGSQFSIMIIKVVDEGDSIVAKAGVFYAGVIAGCNCADDPTPVDTISEYCEIRITISKLTATCDIALLAP